MIKRIRKGDIVFINAGEEKGKTGKVLKVETKKDRLYVEKMNIVKKHLKPTQNNPQGGIIDKEAPIHISNVQLFCPSCGKGVKVGLKKEDGKTVRYCRSCNKVL